MQGSQLIDLCFPKLLLSVLTKAPKEGILLPFTDKETREVKGPHIIPRRIK